VHAVDIARAFAPEATALALARRFLREVLAAELPDDDGGDLADTLVLAANELATNAVLHARTEFTVRLLVDDARVRVEVTDENTRVPQPCLAPTNATSGRGLAIVDASGLSWGIDRHAEGKTVWLQAERR
jgi:anti-sigma regulatory factor (Ser/Thr protein kinase)